MTYKEKLLDPRWQKKRLEILNRDFFTCTSCGDTTKTLNVHHCVYSGDPWEADSKHLLTLCESCHKYETENRANVEVQLLKKLKQSGFLTNALRELSSAFSDIELTHSPDVVADVIRFTLTNRQIMERLQDLYFEHLYEKHNNG